MRCAWVVVVLGLVPAPSFAGIEINSKRGEQVFLTQGCPTCHTVRGGEQKAAPNIVRRLDRNYTAAAMASEFWNHAPQMWEAAKKNPSLKPELSESDVADLFGFLYAVRFFENLGDAGRGKRVFTQNCVKCHALVGDGVPGNPVAEWASLVDPVDLLRRTWLHADDIVRALDSRREKWSRLDSQEMTDLLVYLQNLPATRSRELHFELPTGEKGAELISAKGCVDCHKGSLALEKRLGKLTLTEVATAMWNHAPKITSRMPRMTVEEMREIISYAWSQQFFSPLGDERRGRRVFQAKCSSCHEGSGTARRIRPRSTPYSALTMVSAVWRHDWRMIELAAQKGQSWPTLTASQMADLAAYLGSLR
ncbi:MAG: cytochrome c [Acidobacteriia bacterium]|nr:cytochrome c [Terriglobia bacterium]